MVSIAREPDTVRQRAGFAALCEQLAAASLAGGEDAPGTSMLERVAAVCAAAIDAGVASARDVRRFVECLSATELREMSDRLHDSESAGGSRLAATLTRVATDRLMHAHAKLGHLLQLEVAPPEDFDMESHRLREIRAFIEMAVSLQTQGVGQAIDEPALRERWQGWFAEFGLWTSVDDLSVCPDADILRLRDSLEAMDIDAGARAVQANIKGRKQAALIQLDIHFRRCLFLATAPPCDDHEGRAGDLKDYVESLRQITFSMVRLHDYDTMPFGSASRASKDAFRKQMHSRRLSELGQGVSAAALNFLQSSSTREAVVASNPGIADIDLLEEHDHLTLAAEALSCGGPIGTPAQAFRRSADSSSISPPTAIRETAR
ncbi:MULTISPECIES: hypothetical protein [Dyella]|uniref:Uncharacterized protein n=2 Tax=Dyella TaxID=231454 RepID=A0A4R0YU49_9GAMM|nr:MULTISPECIES: hypothetical protein [Dyella]TBR39616.1 hypothetical protein EYV96_05290 [Dyella terrae]TCI12802.1 hypothetical protein EZM97_05580 [Dyella soli]